MFPRYHDFPTLALFQKGAFDYDHQTIHNWATRFDFLLISSLLSPSFASAMYQWPTNRFDRVRYLHTINVSRLPTDQIWQTAVLCVYVPCRMSLVTTARTTDGDRLICRAKHSGHLLLASKNQCRTIPKRPRFAWIMRFLLQRAAPYLHKTADKINRTEPHFAQIKASKCVCVCAASKRREIRNIQPKQHQANHLELICIRASGLAAVVKPGPDTRLLSCIHKCLFSEI